jgi:hypothetical protein
MCWATRTGAEYLNAMQHLARNTANNLAQRNRAGRAASRLNATRARVLTGTTCAIDGESIAMAHFDRPTPRGNRELWTSTSRSESSTGNAVNGSRERDTSMTSMKTNVGTAAHRSHLTTSASPHSDTRASICDWPLVLLGPGGDYARRYVAVGDVIECVPSPCFATRADALEPSAPAGFVARALTAIARSFESLAIEIFSVRDAEIDPTTASDTDANLSENHDESDTEATARPQACPRIQAEERLLADHARARGRARGQQGHGVRARRVAHQEGRAGAGVEQGSLFDRVG